MRLIMTRRREVSEALGGRRWNLRHSAIVAPLLDIIYTPPQGLSLDGVQALVATSRHGPLAFDEGTELLAMLEKLPIYCVGLATRLAACAFEHAHEGPGTAAELADMIARELDPGAGALLYLSGETIAFDLVGSLAARGFNVRREVVYRAEPASALQPDVVAAVREGWAEGVLLFSTRTSETWAQLIAWHGLADQARRLAHFAISEAAARPLARLAPTRVLWPPRPNLDELLAVVDREAARR